jgi:hypothetical protein
MSISGISQIAPSQLSEIATIPGEDMAVPGYGFPEDADDDLPPAHGTNGTHAPASAAPVLQAAEAPSAAAAPVRTQTPTGQRSAWNKLPRETLQAIADERTHCEGLSHREFAQRLHEKGIYSATAKDGSKVPANHRRVSEWLERAREEGML